MKKIFLISILIFFGVLVSCSINTEKPPFDVYICGSDGNFAKWWINGEAEANLTNGARDADARSIFVSDNNVYICGYEDNASGKHVAKWWINGIEQPALTNGVNHAIANSIVVSDGDVYICGFEFGGSGSYAKWWKNGVEQPTLTDGSNYAAANSIQVYNDDVYICGYERNGSGRDVAKWWKNGVEQPGLAGGVSSNAYANSIKVYQGNVYICGDDGGAAKWWKNGVEQMSHGSYTKACTIFVSRGDVYISGYDRSPGPGFTPTWWKNSVEQPAFSPPAPSTNPACAYSIFVYNDDVYMCGNYTNIAKWWINGIEQPDLGTVSAYARSIIVAPRY